MQTSPSAEREGIPVLNRRRRHLTLFALATVVATGTSCSSGSQPDVEVCGSVHTGFEVSKEVVLNTPIRRALAIDSELRKAYVPYKKRDDSGGVLMIDIDQFAITDDVPFPDGVGALALDAKSHLVYVADSRDSIAVLDGDTGERVRSLTIQDGVGLLALDGQHDVLYAASWTNDGLRAVNPETGDVITTIDIPFRPTKIAVDEANRLVYAAATGGEDGGRVVTIDGSQNSVIASSEVKGSDGGLAVDTANHRVFVSSSYYGVVSVIDAATGEVTDTFADFHTPHSMALCGDALFVANRDPGDIVVADAFTGDIAHTLSVGTHPAAMAVDGATGNVWVLSAGDTARTTPGLLSVITPKA